MLDESVQWMLEPEHPLPPPTPLLEIVIAHWTIRGGGGGSVDSVTQACTLTSGIPISLRGGGGGGGFKPLVKLV